MSDTPSGLDVLQSQVQRRSRSVPPPRRQRSDDPPATESQAAENDAAGASQPRAAGESQPRVETAMTTAPAGTAPAPTRRRRPPTTASTERSERPTTSADEPVTNLAVRVRRSLDDRLSDILHALRKDGVRSSKVELIEMLLWELPPDPSDSFRRRLADFRAAAPRQDSLSPASKE